MAASCLNISCILGLLVTLPNPLSSLKHPQGSSALHAEPCKAKNSEGHWLQPCPHQGKEPSTPRVQMPRGIAAHHKPHFQGGDLGSHPSPAQDPVLNTAFHPP